MKKILLYLLIGIIQGLTEPLPISSSAHMIFFNHYFGNEELSLSTEVYVNFASFLAIFIFFFPNIWKLCKNTFNKNTKHYLNYHYSFKLFIGSIPTIMVGLLLNDFIDSYFLNFFTSSCCLIITSFVLFYAFYKLKNNYCVNEEITMATAVNIGILQSIAIIPGLSRSGLTIAGGLSQNTTLKQTMQFSFFLYLIASFGAFILTIIKSNFSTINIETLISCLGSFFTTTISIRWFYKKLDQHKILFFAFYCLCVGIINLIIYFF